MFATALEEDPASVSPDIPWVMVALSAHQLMGDEAEALYGAAYGQPSEKRVNSHNGPGCAPGTWVGSVELAIPKLRTGSYFPEWFLERGRAPSKRRQCDGLMLRTRGLHPARRESCSEPWA